MVKLMGLITFFTEVKSFKKMIEMGVFIEWAEVHSNYYGTSKEFIDMALKKGQSLIFDLDVQGADSFKDYFGEKANIIFIAPPSLEDLEKRLRGRATDEEEVIKRRLNNAKKEILRKNDYDYCLVNDDFEPSYGRLKEIVGKVLGV